MKSHILDNLKFLGWAVLGCAIWWLLCATVGEHYATAVGPEFLMKLPIALPKIALALWMRRLIMTLVFPTIHEFSARGTKAESDWQRLVRMPGGHHDPMVWVCPFVHLGALLVSALVVLFAF